MAGYTKRNIPWTEVKGLAIPRKELELTAVGIGLIHLLPGKGYTFTHAHREQEEVYIVVGGKGQMLLNGALVPIVAGDYVRVDPATKRALRADDDSELKVICAGAVPPAQKSADGAMTLIDDGIPDFDDIPPWYADDPTIPEKNAAIRKRMGK